MKKTKKNEKINIANRCNTVSIAISKQTHDKLKSFCSASGLKLCFVVDEAINKHLNR